jgi:hypothetical protein
MKIQILDGSVQFVDGTVTKQMDRQVFLQSNLSRSSKEVVANGPWITYNFRPEPGVACDAVFKENRLQQIFLLMRIPTDDSGEWTEELELGRKRKHDEWLRSQLGMPPYEYPWGTVASEYDPRGCVSDIIVSYSE